MNANPYAPPAAPLTRQPGLVSAAPALWNPDAAGAWSLLLTPIFGSTLVWMNWNTLGERARARMALLWILASATVFALCVFISGAIGLPYIILWYFACQRPQTQYVKVHWSNGYPRKPWLVTLLIGLGCLIALSVVLGYLSEL